MQLALQSFERLTNMTGEQALDVLARAHPVLVHFPIALLLAGALAELGRMLLGRPGRSPIAFYCVVLGTLGALVAGVSGWFWADLDPPSAKQADLLAWHRWTAVGAASLAVLALLVGSFSNGESGARAARAYRLLLFLAAAAVSFAGKKGGDLVWGEGHLFEGLEPPPTRDAQTEPQTSQVESSVDDHAALPTPAEPDLTSGLEIAARVDFDRDVRPIFEASCVRCHGSKKKKGGLRLDREDGLYEGDRDLWVIVPGAPDESLLYELVTLPPDDSDRMPEEDDPLTPDQIDVLRRWIAEGAVWGDDELSSEVGDG
ncbi:MAG: hypothetical protein H6831_14135 [Planctomycetes bacterium]|nr:hypothetical protein [Planctomycetota bacterium]MCB9905540.1 hypothetical protein [Planctomycetota bacterium]